MRTCCLTVLLLLCFSLGTKAGRYVRVATDTSGGYCEGDFGKIKVGETSYNDEKCQKILCGKSMHIIQGCGSATVKGLSENCQLVSNSGHYPHCCIQYVQCDASDDSS
ncbi:toxin-like protein 14 [Argiope bruennichi]|uniref:toxin-like protein 14 n=1 Tax=Argiope bruennichi TaxID=94029 RepID=UPI002493DE1C|nr:toxin-like protein 14 [Argiope bruennichi]